MGTRLILIIIGLSILTRGTACNNDSTGILFQRAHSWADIREQARRQNKYVFFDLYATWCAPCKLMDSLVYGNDSVAKSMNEKFISVKVQMDTTNRDDQYVKDWYSDAKQILQRFKPEGYPTFLFFTPDGQLISRDIGFKSIPDFLNMEHAALDPQRLKFSELLNDYQSGHKDYNILPALADFVRTILKSRELAQSMARDYMDNFLDKQPDTVILLRGNIQFIDRYSQFVYPGDPVFHALYFQPKRADSAVEYNGWAHSFLSHIITREELEDKLVLAGKPRFKRPHWNHFQAILSANYPDMDTRKIMLEFEAKYYRDVDLNWHSWAEVKERLFKDYPPGKRMGFWTFNLPAWDAFLHCNDRRILRKALTWSENAIAIDGEQASDQAFDTKANLLYKLGQVSEAITTEEKAIWISGEQAKSQGRAENPYVKGFRGALEDMKQRKATYIDEGAIWTTETSSTR
jgi:thiol-disulfide isomerase/thioredoxin